MPFVHNNSVRFYLIQKHDFEALKADFTEERIFVVNMSNKYKMGKNKRIGQMLKCKYCWQRYKKNMGEKEPS